MMNQLSEHWSNPDFRQPFLNTLAIGVPGSVLLSTQGDTTGEKIGGFAGGVFGTVAEAGLQGYLATQSPLHSEVAHNTLTGKVGHYGLAVLGGIAPIAAQLIGQGIGGMIDPSNPQPRR